MGSVVPHRRDSSYAQDLLREIARQSDEAAEAACLPCIPRIVDLIEDALAHPDARRRVLTELACFITESLGGSVPDPRR